MDMLASDGYTLIIIIALIAYIAGLITAIALTAPKIYR